MAEPDVPHGDLPQPIGLRPIPLRADHRSGDFVDLPVAWFA